MSEGLRAGLIGCGFFARNHLYAWRDIAGVDVVAVCDRDRDKAEAAAAEFGVAGVFDDAEAMLSLQQLDFVDVVTTVESHRPLVELAARHGVAAICQKPFAETREDGRAMVEACAAAGVILMVHENFRFQHPLRTMGEMIAGGAVGAPFYATIDFRHRWDVYAGQPYLRTVERLAIMDVGLHLFDVARYLMGDVTSLHCRTQRVNPEVAGEDVFVASLSHEGGRVSVCSCSFYSRRKPEPFPEVLASVEGDEGTLDLLQDYRLIHHTAEGAREIAAEGEVPAWAERPWHVVQASVLATQRHFVKCLRSGAEPETSGAHNLVTLELALAAYDSAAADEAVRFFVEGAAPAEAAARARPAELGSS